MMIEVMHHPHPPSANKDNLLIYTKAKSLRFRHAAPFNGVFCQGLRPEVRPEASPAAALPVVLPWLYATPGGPLGGDQ